MENSSVISIHIASILGPVLIAISLSEYINFRIWKDVNPTLVYLNGLFLFTTGVIIVHFHNFWISDWTVLITLLGWLVLLFGAWRMFLPSMKQSKDNLSTRVLLVFIFITGLFLTVMAYLS